MGGPISIFVLRKRADEMAAFMREGMGDSVQSVNVVAVGLEDSIIVRTGEFSGS
jgi:hypothetical protein